jgi:hypothetical protein
LPSIASPTGAICDFVFSDFNGLRRHFGSRAWSEGQRRQEDKGVISFGLRPGKISEKRNERFAMRNETKRIPGRKSLESLWALNQPFRGPVCFQRVNRRFISRFFTYQSRIDHDRCEAGLIGFLKNNIKFRPAWQEIVGFS